MWGYDREEDTVFIPHKTQDEHFELFCLVLERGFAIHTGHSDRLVVEFNLTDTGSRRYLPRVQPKRGVSFRIPEGWLKPSEVFLHYDPCSDADIPELACFHPESNTFVPYDYEHANLPESSQGNILLPVVKLSTLKGLHYIKDIACLQMYQLDFNQLKHADPALAEQVRSVLARKMERFIEFAHPWVQANHAERVAQEYLATHRPRLAVSRELTSGASISRESASNRAGPHLTQAKRQKAQPVASVRSSVQPAAQPDIQDRAEPPFLSWD
ncbi:hypothetical protein G8770_08470 [Aestuariicella hydrocarbonica]|uniref:Uncharacterized protein n=1 Tax=Pseudomaricurvus hydrocarbonicus TaxID=1470433 RepID=A0A9E5MH64_9GAMM|nr:hypothetical protein [Aestuariicella hydrocarbonica]NHO65571.1 hypothetical protein [Aestuariicella hydrocarbonica]